MEFHEPESSQIISSINTGQRRKHEEESDINELDVEPDFKVLNKKQRIIGLHPNGIKPLGNLYLTDQNEENLATSGLGTLKVLSEEQLVDILMELSPVDLCILSLVSKTFYAFVQLDDLWKPCCLEEFQGDWNFQGTWKETYRWLYYQKRQQSFRPTKPLYLDKFYSDALYNRWYVAQLNLESYTTFENIDRRSNLSLEAFINEYEIPNKPVIITDIVVNWTAYKTWNEEFIKKQFGNIKFKTDHGVAIQLSDYINYSKTTPERRPIYIFDNEFLDKVPLMKEAYEIPPYFRNDFFSLLKGDDRPSFRWILIGGARSGATFHKDPNATSAWNGLVYGRKKWIFFPPNQIPPGVHPSEDGWEVTTPESVIEWFVDFYGSLKNISPRPLECVTKPGELLFIPSGWWHSALNLEPSVAFTQNFVSPQNVSRVNRFLKVKKKRELYELFHKSLRQEFPEIEEKLKKQEETYDEEESQSAILESKSSSFWKNLTKDQDKNFTLFG